MIPGGQGGTFGGFNNLALYQGHVAFDGLEGQLGTLGGRGVYSDTGGTLRVVADTNTLIPGRQTTFTTDFFGAFANGISLDGGNVAFVGFGEAGSGLYAEFDGVLLKIIETSDVLDGRAVTDVQRLSVEALSGNQIAFGATLGEFDDAIYVATVPEPHPTLAAAIAIGAVVVLRSRGVIPVAILGSESFDVADVDPATLAFGPGAAPLAHRNGPHPKDANHDGIPDLLAHFLTEAARIAAGDKEACVTGELLDGTPFEGCDSIRPVPPQ